MRKFSTIALLGVLLWIVGTVRGQQIDARGVGMAFSNSADTRGLEQVGANPATLALQQPYNFEFNFLSLNVHASNNSLTRGIYDQYFTTGDSLTQSDKTSLLNSIPATGLQGNFAARLNTFSVYVPHFSLSVVGLGNGYFNLPKEIAELALFGNEELGRIYDFSNFDGKGWAGGSVMMGLAFSLPFLKSESVSEAAFGITAKYISGLRYFEVINSSGSLYNLDFDNPTLRLDGLLEARTSEGGTGFGYDLGLLLQSENKFTASFAVLNAYSSVNWTNNPRHVFYSVQSDSFNISSNGLDDSLIVEEDTSFTVPAFRTSLPTTLNAGVAYRLVRPLLVTANLDYVVNSSMGTLKSTRYAFGMEFTGIPLLPLRAGFSRETEDGFSFAAGLGLNLHYWFVDVAYISHGGLSAAGASGATIAATTRLRF